MLLASLLYQSQWANDIWWLGRTWITDYGLHTTAGVVMPPSMTGNFNQGIKVNFLNSLF